MGGRGGLAPAGLALRQARAAENGVRPHLGTAGHAGEFHGRGGLWSAMVRGPLYSAPNRYI